MHTFMTYIPSFPRVLKSSCSSNELFHLKIFRALNLYMFIKYIFSQFKCILFN